MRKLILIFWILLLVVFLVTVDADDSQNIVFTGTYSFNNEGTDADSAWLFIRYDGTLVDSIKITPEDLQWDGYYQYIHACTNDSVWGWSGWWIYFDGLTVSIPELATIATARDSSYALEASVTALRDTAQYLVTADTTGISENVSDQVWREDLSGHNIYGAAAANILALAPIQALALAPGSHEQTTTRLALNLTATTNDVFNGCMIAARSGVNAGRMVRITDYEAYSGDSGVVIVSPPLVLAATENQLFVIALADHAEGDTIGLPASVYAEFTDGNNEDAFKYAGTAGGDNHVIIVAYDTVASTVLARATITIINADSNSQRWNVTTNDSGIANFSMDDGTYLVIGAGTREMGELDTISVSDDLTDTLFFWSVVVTAAATSQVCTVYGILCKPDGSRLANADVTFTLSSSVTDTSVNVGILNYEVYGVSNDTGYVEKQLVKNGNNDVSSYYQVTIRHGDIMPLTYEIFIPADSTTFDFVLGGRQR